MAEKKVKEETTEEQEPLLEEEVEEVEEGLEVLRKLSLPPEVTEAMEKRWKKEFPNCEVFAMRFSDTEAYVFRTLTRFEYKTMLKTAAQSQMSAQELELHQEENVVERCLLHPKLNRVDMESMKAGTITLLADAILNASGFTAMGGPVRL